MHNPKSVEFHQCSAKRHLICFYHSIKDNERNLYQDLLTTGNTDSDLKVRALLYANELLVRVRLSFQNFLQTRSKCRQNTKKCLGKDYWRVVVVDKKQTTMKHISICFLPQYQHQRKCFFFSARELRKVLRDTLTRAGMNSYRQRPSNFSLVRFEHAHASYPGLSFRPPGFGKKGKFRDWTRNCSASYRFHFG